MGYALPSLTVVCIRNLAQKCNLISDQEVHKKLEKMSFNMCTTFFNKHYKIK